MKRRKFIGMVSVGAAAVTVGTYISCSSFDNAVRSIIVREMSVFGYKVEVKEVMAFVAGANKARLWESFPILKKELLRWYAQFEGLGIKLPASDKYKWAKQEIVRQFLFSTNFFYEGMDVSKPMHYLRIYNPYDVPCCNPFSNMYYPG